MGILKTLRTGVPLVCSMLIKRLFLSNSRLSRVLDSIVDPDQTCSVSGRAITSNVTLLRDILDYIERTNETAILVSLDQEKAFDRVDRTFLMQLLNRYGFGPNFCRWVSTVYNGAFMRIIYFKR